jgi:putative membrane protein
MTFPGKISRCMFVVAFAGIARLPLSAHDVADASEAAQWSWEPGIIIPLAALLLIYSIGFSRMAKRGLKSAERRSAIPFALGWLALLIALDSPIHRMGSQLFWVHMMQHEILMLVAAPLLVLGKPIVTLLWALPLSWRSGLGRFTQQRTFHATWMFVTTPLIAWLAHAIALWGWHVPALFELTLKSDFAHGLQHLSFLGTALLFWWTLIQGHRVNYGGAFIYVFTTAAHSSVLGALLTFSRTPWYPSYLETAPHWGLTSLEDQQLGGLIMWVPAGVILFLISVGLLFAWLRESDRRLEYTKLAAVMQSRASGGSNAS